MPYLELKGLRKQFGQTVAADDVDVSLEQGHILCLLGPSGCGKTTTLRMIAGLTRQDRGSIRLKDREISHVPTHKRRIGLVFQNWALFPHLNVFDNIAFGLRTQKIPKDQIVQRVEEILRIVQLPEFGDRLPSQLSGGQQQRIALARSLVTNPDLMLFDEPLSNLDLKLRNEMREELRRINRELNLTSVYVTHDQGEALSLGDKVAVMMEGRIVEIGPPETLFERPRTTYVADFLGVENVLSGQLVDDGSFEIAPGVRTGLYASPLGQEEPIAVGVRAEQIEMGDRLSEAYDNAYAGSVRRRDYQGSRILYAVAIEGTETELRVSHTGATGFEIGQPVHVGWNDRQALPLISPQTEEVIDHGDAESAGTESAGARESAA